MVKWVLARPLPVLFLATLVIGLLFVSIGLFTISSTVGLVGTGVLVVAGGHWVTYLTSIRGGVAR